MSDNPTTFDDLFVREIAEQAVSAGLSGMKALYGSSAVILNNTLLSQTLGEKVLVPYTGSLSPMTVRTSAQDNTEPEVDGIASDTEESVVYQGSKIIEATEWARQSQKQGVDPYETMASQLVEVAERAIDTTLIDQAFDEDRVLVHDASSDEIDWKMCVDGQSLFEDEGLLDIALMIVHSNTLKSLRNIVDGNGRPMLQEPTAPGLPHMFAGAPIAVSNRLGVQGGSWSAVTPSGTTPPTVTLSGTPTGAFKLKVKITKAGTRGTSQFKYSTNGGYVWSKPRATEATFEIPESGTTINFAAGTYAIDNLYSATVTATTYRSIIAKTGSMCAYVNGSPVILSQANISKPSMRTAIHIWFAGHVYRVMRGKSLPGVVMLKHKVST